MERILNPVRIRWCVIYLAMGIILFCIFYIKHPGMPNILLENFDNILWCFAFSAAGIGLGLWNSRNAGGLKLTNHIHYVTYYFSLLLIATLASFTVFLIGSGPVSYTGSALAGILIGFIGDSFNEALAKLIKQ